jgi:ubiquinone biosynthesis protein
MGTVIWDVVVMVLVTIVFLMILSSFANRMLGVRIGLIRLVLAGAVGLAAEVGFETQFVWGKQAYTPALLPLQIGIVLLVAIAFLVIAELLVPAGSVPRPNQWWPGITARFERSRRYAQITRIALKNGLVPFRPNTDPTSTGSAERTRQGRAIRTALESAGGAFIKLGQLLSTRSDLLPPEYLTELAALQERVPAADWASVRDQLETELGCSLEDLFADIEHVPLAAASIGQVHRATLRDGRAVAVKVQRPGITPLVERDIDIMIRLANKLERTTGWGRDLGVAALAQSFADSLRNELDYRIEAGNMAAMALTQARHGADERVGIPEHFPQFCTAKVLTMELVQGGTLSDPVTLQEHTAAERDRQARRLLRSTLTQIIDDGVFHSDLHPGNIIMRADGELVLLDFGSVGRLDSELRAQIGDVLIAFYRGDAGAFTDALLGFIERPDELDETALRRQIGVFVATRLGPGASLDVTVFTQMVRMLTENRIAVPAELGSAFRAVATVEGTLRHLSPGFEMLTAASDFAKDRVTAGLTPDAVRTAVTDELLTMLPMIRRLPRRINRLTGELAEGRLSVNIRLFADKRDRALVHSLANLLVVTFLAGTFAITAAMLLISGGGPVISPTLTLFQVFGYLLVIVAGLLTLRVLFDVFRLRGRD